MDSKKSLKAIRLQTRLILCSTLLIVLIMALVFLLVEKRQSETIQEEAKKRGMAIAQNLASVSTNALLTYNYIILEQNAERVALEEDISYVIIHDKENKVAAYSQHDEKQGMVLTDDVSQEALVAREPLIQSTFSSQRTRLLDISIPVYIKESPEKWGTVRVGLSLERMHEQISKTRLNLLLLGLFALLLGILGSIFFSRRITQPISKLVETTISAARGDLDQVMDIRTGDEIEELSRNFNHMIEQIRLHRNELEERLREITSLKAYTDDILASMTNGLMTIDLEKKIVTVNEMGVKIIGRGKEGMVGFSMEQVLGEEHPLYKILMETLAEGKGISHIEVEWRRDGESLWLIAGTSLLVSGEGKTIGALAIFQDITQIKVLEEKLRQADRLAALGTLSAGLAHEIKNPLSAIKTFVQLLPQKIGNPSFMEKFNTTVPREIDRINHLVEDLLELTRRRVRPLVDLNVDSLIYQVVDLHGEELKRRQVALKVRLAEGIPPIHGDAETLSRVFSNLIINAAQAMPNGGSLSISAQLDSSSSSLRISFRDTGIGMDETTARNIFNPFFTTKDKEGCGPWIGPHSKDY